MAISSRAATTFTDRIIQHTAVKDVVRRALESRLTDCLRTGHSDVWQTQLAGSLLQMCNKQLVA
jgi:hypothetical protein